MAMTTEEPQRNDSILPANIVRYTSLYIACPLEKKYLKWIWSCVSWAA